MSNSEKLKPTDAARNIFLLMICCLLLYYLAEYAEKNKQCYEVENFLLQNHCFDEFEDREIQANLKAIIKRVQADSQINPASKKLIEQKILRTLDAVTEEDLQIIAWNSSEATLPTSLAYRSFCGGQLFKEWCKTVLVLGNQDIGELEKMRELALNIMTYQQFVESQSEGKVGRFFRCADELCGDPQKIEAKYLSNLVTNAYMDADQKKDWIGDDLNDGFNWPAISILLDQKGLSPDKSSLFSIFYYQNRYYQNQQLQAKYEKKLADPALSLEDTKKYQRLLKKSKEAARSLEKLLTANYRALSALERRLLDQIVSDPNLVQKEVDWQGKPKNDQLNNSSSKLLEKPFTRSKPAKKVGQNRPQSNYYNNFTQSMRLPQRKS